jgi:hypothetical protein
MTRSKQPKKSRREKLLATLIALRDDLDMRYRDSHPVERNSERPIYGKRHIVIKTLPSELKAGELGIITYALLAELVAELSSESNASGTG